LSQLLTKREQIIITKPWKKMRPCICFGGGDLEGECPHRAEQTNGRIGLKEMGDGWIDGWLQLHRE